MQIRHTTVFTFSLMAFVACTRTSTDSTNPEPAPVVAEAPPPVESEPAPAPAAEAPPTEKQTHDDEIFGVTDVINAEAVAQAEFMKKWAKHQQVKQYAADIIETHNRLRDSDKVARNSVELREGGSKLADDLKRDSQQKLNTLEEIAKGDALDRAYIDMQVELSATWIGAIDNQLTPMADTEALRNQLTALRNTVEQDHQKAVKLQGELAGKKKKAK